MPQDIMVSIPVGNLMDVQMILDKLLDHKQVVAEMEAEFVGAGFGEGLIADTRQYVADLLNATRSDGTRQEA